MCIRLSNSRYLREDLTELAAEALQQIRLQTQTTPERTKAASEGNLVLSEQPAGPTSVTEEEPSERSAASVESVRKEQSSAASVHSSASGRQAWTQEETEMIKTAFPHFDEVPRNTEIWSVFLSDISLEQILQTNPFARIRHKVKNIFKNRK